MKIVDIKEFEGIYKITDTGKVFSIKSNRFIGSNLKDGYSLVLQNVKHAFDTGLANNKNLSIAKRQISCEIVKQIRDRYIPRDSKHGTRAMAREFGIAQYTVSQIIRGLRRTKYESA